MNETTFKIIHEGNLFDGSVIRVIVPGEDPNPKLAILERNQGEHDARFFILDVLETEKAVEKCKRIIQRSMKMKVK